MPADSQRLFALPFGVLVVGFASRLGLLGPRVQLAELVHRRSAGLASGFGTAGLGQPRESDSENQGGNREWHFQAPALLSFFWANHGSQRPALLTDYRTISTRALDRRGGRYYASRAVVPPP